MTPAPPETAASPRKSDEEFLRSQKINVIPFDIWEIPNDYKNGAYPWASEISDETSGDGTAIPSVVVGNLIYHFSDRSDYVLEPMTGRPSPIHLLATEMFREWVPGHDCSYTDELKDFSGNPSLVLLNPPPYSASPDYGTARYLEDIENCLVTTLLVVGKCRLALYCEESHSENETILVFDFADTLRKAGWKLVRCIPVCFPKSMVSTSERKQATADRNLIPLVRYLIIAEPASVTSPGHAS